MATHSNAALPIYCNNDATWRSFLQAVFAGFTAVGLTRTTDTGQVNELTDTKPATYAYSNPSIWQLDSLTGMPIYLSVTPGITNYANSPGLKIEIGTQTNGASVLTGPQRSDSGSPVTLFFGAAVSGGSTSQMFVSRASGRFHFAALDPSSASYKMFVGVERTFDSAGTPTEDGAILYAESNGQGALGQVIPPSGTPPAVFSSLGSVFPHAIVGQSQAGSPDQRVAFLAGSWSSNGLPSQTRALVYRHTDIAELGAVNVDAFGQTDLPYMPLGDGGPGSGSGGTSYAIPWS